MPFQIRSYRINDAEDFLNSLDFMKHFLLEKYTSNPTDKYAGDTLKAFNYVLLMIFDIKNAIDIERCLNEPHVMVNEESVTFGAPDVA